MKRLLTCMVLALSAITSAGLQDDLDDFEDEVEERPLGYYAASPRVDAAKEALREAGHSEEAIQAAEGKAISVLAKSVDGFDAIATFDKATSEVDDSSCGEGGGESLACSIARAYTASRRAECERIADLQYEACTYAAQFSCLSTGIGMPNCQAEFAACENERKFMRLNCALIEYAANLFACGSWPNIPDPFPDP